jgi:hypothetical protein
MVPVPVTLHIPVNATAGPYEMFRDEGTYPENPP